MTLTAKQEEARDVLAGPQTHTLLRGGSRSGKTYILLRAVLQRARKAPGSRHAVLRFRFNACRASIIEDTWPKVCAQEAPNERIKQDRTLWFDELSNGSQIWFGGLDDKERVEKILGREYCTIYLNECTEIAYASRELVRTRLAQKVNQADGVPLQPRMYYDCNPTTKAHWSYRLFFEHRDPEARQHKVDENDYATLQMNPQDNSENLPDGYLATLESMSAQRRRRFFAGEYGEDNPNQLWSEVTLDKWRVMGDTALPEMLRIVVGVDPSGAKDGDENASNDEIGIAVAGLGADGNGYLLEDLTLKAGPATWGKVATTAWERHRADMIVGEVNYGGGMVQFVVRTAKPMVPYKDVHASRGKVVRAEPVASLYEQGRIRHVGHFEALEQEYLGFSNTGYVGEGSPNRADAAIWCFTELFPHLVAQDNTGAQTDPDASRRYTRKPRSSRQPARPVV